MKFKSLLIRLFSFSRYIKALESIRNLRKEQSENVKSFEKELGYLTDTKNKAAEVIGSKQDLEILNICCRLIRTST